MCQAAKYTFGDWAAKASDFFRWNSMECTDSKVQVGQVAAKRLQLRFGRRGLQVKENKSLLSYFR